MRTKGVEQFIQQGAQLIGRKEAQAAVTHFQNPEMADGAGFDLVVLPGQIADAGNYDVFKNRLLLNATAWGFFPPTSKTPSFEAQRRPGKGMLLASPLTDIPNISGYYYRGDDNSESTQRQQSEAWDNMALSFMEIWLRGLHFLRNEASDREDFVKDYLERARVPLPYLWASRHNLPWPNPR